MNFYAFLLIAYLSGSIPFAFIIYYIRTGEDIRRKGSGNPGGTNVLREAGIFYGILTAILDISKAFIPVLIAKKYFGISNELFYIWLAAVLGHMFSIFLFFKGGKGVATTVGGILAIDYRIFLIFISVFLLIIIISRIASISSLSGSFFLLLSHLYFYKTKFIIPVLIIVILIFYKHRANIKRLIKGEERRLFKK